MSITNFFAAPPSDAVVPSTGGPCWDVAHLFPERGNWTEADYLALSTNRPIELSNGCLEVLPMPGWAHQFIARFLFRMLDRFVVSKGIGEVMFPPFPVRLWPEKIREPDVVFVRNERSKVGSYSEGADLVVEVVSEGKVNRERDLVAKRAEYAKAGISEYWIVDPELQQITVLALEGETYREHGVFAPGQVATSKLLEGFSVAASEVFAAANG
jgi:Uma2 family endonuclease